VNIIDVIKRTVMAFPGSYEGMASALGASANVLRNKLSRANDTHHLYLVEAMEIMEQARAANVPDALALLKAMAAEFDMVLMPAGVRRPMGDMSLAEKLLSQAAANNRLGTAVVDAMADGSISVEEMQRITDLTADATQSDIDLQEAARTFADHVPTRSQI
jgi:hypothetical protein